MVRGVLAVVLGFATMSVLVAIGSLAFLSAFVPGGVSAMKAMRDNPSAMPAPTPRYYLMNILLSLLAAIAGGRVTAKIAGTPATTYLIALVFVVLVMGLVSAVVGPRGMTQPAWYKWLIPIIGVVGVLIGGRFV